MNNVRRLEVNPGALPSLDCESLAVVGGSGIRVFPFGFFQTQMNRMDADGRKDKKRISQFAPARHSQIKLLIPHICVHPVHLWLKSECGCRFQS
jgi:hypothetical protein